MNLCENSVVYYNDGYYQELVEKSILTKDLYNKLTYIINQYYTTNDAFIPQKELYNQIKITSQWKALPNDLATQTRLNVLNNWSNFFKALKSYKVNPSLFTSSPRPPTKYKKKDQRYVMMFTDHGFSKKLSKSGIIKLPKSNICFKTKQTNIKQVHIIPENEHFIVSVIYERETKPNENLNQNLIAGIDLGVNNLVALTSNKVGFQPLLINGKPLKSINHYYNKTLAMLKSKLPQGQYASKRINRLTMKRNLKIKDYLHKTSKFIINHLVANNIGVLVIGHNNNQKQNINIGKINNQNFVSIPYYKFIQQLTYKAELVGIKVIIQEESYTSKCSFLDNESIQKHNTYLGKRIKRGLFKTSTDKIINADVNASYNIIIKAVGNAFQANPIQAVVVRPILKTINF